MKIFINILGTIICVGLFFASIGAYQMTGELKNLFPLALIVILLILLYKPKKIIKSKTAYKIENHVVKKYNGSKITDEEIPFLIQEGYKEALKMENQNPCPKFHRTLRDEDLSFNFSQNHGEKLKQLEDNIYKASDNLGKVTKKFLKEATYNEIKDVLNRCQILIDSFEKCKKFCYGKGKGGTIYFQDMWEFCHNSNNDCFSYIQSTLDLKLELEELLQTK